MNKIDFAGKYVSTRNSFLTKYLQECSIINTCTFPEKEAFNYEDHKLNEFFIVEKYFNGLTIVKSNTILPGVKGLVDVTTNPMYSDSNITQVKFSKAIIEGSDGVGKSSTVSKLIEQGIVCLDRSELICKYMLFDVPMETRISAYCEYLKEISPYFVIFLTNNSKAEIESRINSRPIISDFDKLAYEYNVLYLDTYNAIIKLGIDNPIELVDCTGLTVDEQVNKVKECILRRTSNE